LADNDPAASAKDVVAEMRSRIPWPILYVHEPRRGLAFARNATLDALPREARWIAFIDDDEEPAPAWLDELLATALTHAAPIVAGPVRPEFQSQAPEWIVAGGWPAWAIRNTVRTPLRRHAPLRWSHARVPVIDLAGG
jgi:succinoglycan biosynthesis protein ExoM